jgi:hypothetical protein
MFERETLSNGLGQEFATAMRLVRFMRAGRLVVWPEQQSPPPVASTCNATSAKSPTVTKLALNRTEAAKELSVSIRTFDRWVANGLIRPSGVGRKKIFGVTELQRFLKETSESIDL